MCSENKWLHRSEAHHAALLFCDLTNGTAFGGRLLDAASVAAGQSIGKLRAVYVEPAPFRDGWKALTDTERHALIRELVLWQGGTDQDTVAIENMTDKKGRIQAPYAWNRTQIIARSAKFLRLIWMFHARADMLVETELAAVWLELKVHSRHPPQRLDGYVQSVTQQDIAKKADSVMPFLRSKLPINMIIQIRPAEPKNPNVITWDQIDPERGRYVQ